MNRIARPPRRAFGYVLALLLLGAHLASARTPSGTAAELDKAFARSSLQIAGTDGRIHTFQVWIADNDARRSRGLMYVRELAEAQGMLFLYSKPQPVSMWMKNTFIPLDMFFVRRDGRIASIAANTTPHSLKTIHSQQPVLAVIELNGGAAARLKIRAGDQVIHPAFQP